jgi:hypothetical protein
LSAADYRLKPRLRICGITGNLTHDTVHERPVSYTMFDMIGRFPKAKPDKTIGLMRNVLERKEIDHLT